MGKKERKQMNDIVQLIGKAVNESIRLLDTSSYAVVEDLLLDCQSSINFLIEHLAFLYEEEITLNRKLKAIGKTLNKVIENEYSGNQKIEALKEIRTDMDCVIKDLPYSFKREVIFLPYKASMWDSLESVWRAAMEDENCIVRVIPIPYFEKDAKGDFSKMHWEGDQYPEYVSITRYEDYDLEEHHPDMIFIHNPYDQFNRVTSIHPDYYSWRLKDYTDKLVYIPYFILDEMKPTERIQIERKKHYCLTSAVLNSHYTVVQSEAMRTIYINVLSQQYGEHTRSSWEKKILGLGSPKIDKVSSLSPKDIVVPKEWLSVIEKPDGTWKKIVFYNISLGAFLKYTDKMLDKIEAVLDFFKHEVSEYALLWRPHPLYLSTIESVRPELADRYKAIVETYKKEGWGIYDDTADMERAVILSDVYYGDGSSVKRLYEKTGKKIMYQGLGVFKE